MTVSNIEDHKPHLVIQAKDGVHVVPKSYFEGLAKGREEWDLLHNEEMFRAIIKEWLALTDPDQ